MLARIAHELYWVGRSLSRAEHTARLLDGVFHADLQGPASDTGQARLSWEALLAIMGADPADGAAGRDDVASLLTLDPSDPASVLFCVSSAREGARRVRDVFSAEMWEAINTFHLGLLRRDMSAALRSGLHVLSGVKSSPAWSSASVVLRRSSAMSSWRMRCMSSMKPPAVG